MFERMAAVVTCAFFLGCAQAHDLDAMSAGLRDDGGTDEGEGTAGRDGDSGRGGSGGRASAGSGGGFAGSGSGTSGTGTGGSGSGFAGSGSGTSGSSGGTGQPIFGDVSSCSPCSGAMGSMGALEPCCTADGACGLDLSPINGLGPTCAQQNAPGSDSMDCPEYVFNGNFMLTSCCGADGLCGVRIMQTAPLGCVNPELLGDLVEPAGGDMTSGGFGGMNRRNRNDGPARCGAGVD